MTVLVEAAVESLQAALAAAEGGAHRVELCTDLAQGGTTPDMQLLRDCVSLLRIPVFVLVRPRPGDFHYAPAEHRLMLEQIQQAKQAGAHGIVTGALSGTGQIAGTTPELLRAARPLPLTFHRASDQCREVPLMIEALIAFGVQRVLTSGGAPSALEGAGQIRRLVKQAKGRMTIVAGGGITGDNVAQLVRETGVREVHFSVRDAAKVRSVLASLGVA